jgi:hypothetical protein
MPPSLKTMKTSLRLRLDLWKRAKYHALLNGRELQDVVNAALESYLPKRIKLSDDVVLEETAGERRVRVLKVDRKRGRR